MALGQPIRYQVRMLAQIFRQEYWGFRSVLNGWAWAIEWDDPFDRMTEFDSEAVKIIEKVESGKRLHDMHWQGTLRTLTYMIKVIRGYMEDVNKDLIEGRFLLKETLDHHTDCNNYDDYVEEL